MVVCFYNNKGGVGKTTLATSVAFRAMEKSKELNFFDMDKQQNAMKWLSNDTWDGGESYIKDGVNIIAGDSIDNISSLIDSRKINIIDSPPAREIVDYIDSRNIPVDVWIVPVKGRFSLDGASGLLEDLKQRRRSDRIVFVCNMVDVNTSIGKSQIEQAKILGIELYKYVVGRSMNFDKAEDMCVPVWNIPYAIRSGAVQSLQLFCDWILKGCPDNKTSGIDINSKVGRYAV